MTPAELLERMNRRFRLTIAHVIGFYVGWAFGFIAGWVTFPGSGAVTRAWHTWQMQLRETA